MDYKISIIVPIYNSEKYLDKCISSIQNQTINEIEIILVNDGSTDNSKDICNYYSCIDKRIKVINIKNKGVSNARNTGIRNATGKYIMFVDSDDYVDPNWCEEMLKETQDNKDNFIVCGYKILNRREKNKKIQYNLLDENKEVTRLYKNDFFLLYIQNLLNSPCNKIFESKIIKENNILYDINLSLGEDLLFNLQYLQYVSGDIRVINKCTYNYIWEEKISLDNKYYPKLFEIYKGVYHKLYKSLIENDSNMEKYEPIYWKRYFFMMEKVLLNTFSKENKDSILKKLKTNNYILNQKDFKTSLNYLDNNDIKKIYLLSLKSGNYTVVYLCRNIIQILYNLKIKIKRVKE